MLLADQREYAATRTLPSADAMERKQRLEADFPALLRETCGALSTPPPESWLLASAPPQLCNGTVEHGLFTLRQLKIVLLQSCGAHCVFMLGRQPQATTSSLGWALDTPHKCWRETSSDEQCMLWHGGRARTLPSAVDCAAVPRRSALRAPKCALPGSACEPSLLFVGVRGCAVASLSKLLAQAAKQHRRVAPPSFAARRAFYEHVGDTDAGVAATFAQQFNGSMSFDDTLAFLEHTPWLPFRIKRRLPAAKVLFLVCEPLKRMQADLVAVLHSTDERRTDASLLRTLDIGSFDQLERRVMGPCLSGNEDFAACRRVRQAFLERSVYAAMVADWQSAFGTHAVTVLDGSAFEAEPHEVLKQVYSFAGWPLPPAGFSVLTRGASIEHQPRPAGAELTALLDGANAWLADLLSTEFPLRWALNASQTRAAASPQATADAAAAAAVEV